MSFDRSFVVVEDGGLVVVVALDIAGVVAGEYP